MTSPNADHVSRENLVTQWIQDNWPTAPSDDSVCAHCGRKETNCNVLLPIGVRNHVWMHSACWEPWRLALRAKAKRALGFVEVEVEVEVDVDAGGGADQ